MSLSVWLVILAITWMADQTQDRFAPQVFQVAAGTSL